MTEKPASRKRRPSLSTDFTNRDICLILTTVCMLFVKLDPTNKNLDTAINFMADVTRFKNDPVLWLGLKYNMTINEILQLRKIYYKLYLTKFKEILPTQSKEHFDIFLKMAGVSLEKCNRARSLLHEFLSHPHSCELWCDKNNKSVFVNSNHEENRLCYSFLNPRKHNFMTVDEFNSLLKIELNNKREEKRSIYGNNSRRFQFDFCEVYPEQNETDILYSGLKTTQDKSDRKLFSQEEHEFYLIGILEINLHTG